jgi:hypothetical protein
MATANFNQLAALALAGTTETPIYTVPADTKVQINSIRIVNGSSSTVFINAWSVSGGGAGSPDDRLCTNFAIPPNDWRDLVDTKKIAHSVPGSQIRVQALTGGAINVIVGGVELAL